MVWNKYMNYKEAKALKEKLIKGEPIADEYKKSPWDEDMDDENDGEYEMECFKAGTHIDSQGEKEEYTEEDLKEIAAQYNLQKEARPAPLIVGHSSMEAGHDDQAPAFGWGDSAEVRGSSLFMKFKQVPPEMKRLIKTGAYRNRSISLYEDGRIRHCALLGAVQPALELKPVTSFSDGSKYKTYEYSEECNTMADEKKIEDMQKKLNWYEKIFSIFDSDIKSFKDHAEVGTWPKDATAEQSKLEKGGESEEEGESKTKELSEDETAEQSAKERGTDKEPEAVKIETTKQAQADTKDRAAQANEEAMALKGQVEALTKQVATLTAALQNQGKEMEEMGNKAFCESLIKSGKLRPADLEMVLNTMDDKAQVDSIRNYSEEGKPSSLEQYKQYLLKQPKVCEFMEILPQNRRVDAEIPFSKSFDELLTEKMKANPKMEYAAAYKEVAKENPNHPEVKEMAEEMKNLRPMSE